MPNSLRVLVLEDDEQLQRTWARILRRKGHEVTVVKNLSEAEAALSGQFDVFLLDRQLEGEDGWSFKDRAPPGVRVVLMTGNPPENCPPCFVKPGNTEELFRWVEGRM